MNITLKEIDPVNAIIKVDIVKDDYAAEVEKSLKNLRQNASYPGFRKGMVPMGMVKKMYEKSVVVEQVNKTVSTNLYNYIQDNKINILGEPLPNQSEQPVIDFNTQEDFQFCYDIGVAPEIKIKLTAKDKLPYYTIQVEDKLIEQQITSFRSSYGSYGQVKKIADKDMVKGLLAEIAEDGSIKPEGIQIEEAMLMPFYMKDEEEKSKFMDTAINKVVTFNLNKAYEGNEAELSSLLKIKKEEVSLHTGNFTFEIREITRYTDAEINQDLFDKVFGKDTVKSEAEFIEKVKEMIAAQFAPDSDYKFILDARKLLTKKAGNVAFPDEFLKRWLLTSNGKYTNELIEADYPKIIEDLQFHLIKDQIVKDNELKVEEKEIIDSARSAVKAQFAQYGMTNVPENLLENYTKDMLKKEGTVRSLMDKSMEIKITSWIKEHTTLENQVVTTEEFKKLFE